MKRAVLVYQIPVVPGVPYAPILDALYSVQANKFLKVLEANLDIHNMKWQVILDDSFAELTELLSSNNDLLIFPPGAKARCWMYRKQLEESGIPLYFLESNEYQNKNVKNLVDYMSNI